MSALDFVCHWMTDSNSGPWAAKDLRTLASLQATCKEAHSIRDGFIDERKSAVMAHKATMRQLKRFIDEIVGNNREQFRECGEEIFVHPFTGERDFTDCRGFWYDDFRVKDGRHPLKHKDMEGRERLMQMKVSVEGRTAWVHYGLQHHYDLPSDDEDTESDVEHSDYEH